MFGLIWLIFSAFISQVLLIISGYTILFLLTKNVNLSPIQKMAVSFGLGTGFNSIIMFFFILLGFHSRISFLFFIIPVVAIFLIFRIYKSFFNEISEIRNNFHLEEINLIEIFCILILIVLGIFLFSYWFIYPIHSWDALCMWDGKAKFIFFEGNFSYLNWYLPNLDYPLLIPLNLTYIYSIFMQYHYFSKIIFLFFYVFMLIFIYSSLKSFGLNRTFNLIVTTFISITPDLFNWGIVAYAEIPLTYFYTISTILLFYYFKRKSSFYIILSFFLMGFMAWTKNEGLALFLINSLIFILFNLLSLIKKQMTIKTVLKNIGFTSIGVLTYIPWFLFLRFHNLTNQYTSHLTNLYDLTNSIEDLKIIFNFITQSSFMFFIFWISFSGILVINHKALLGKEIFLLFLMIILHLLLYIVIYIITPFELIWHLKTSFYREILHVMPICGFLMGLVIIDIEENPLNNSKIFNAIT